MTLAAPDRQDRGRPDDVASGEVAQGEALPGDALALAGGPLGRHASARAASWLATVVPLLVAASVTMGLSVAQRAHCIQQGWTGSDQFWHGCFSDLPSLYQLGHLDDGLGSYLTGAGATSDHPVLSGSLLALLGGLVPDGAFLDQTRWFVALWAVVATVCALGVVWLTAAARPRHAGLAAQVALSPVLLLAAMVSVDLFGVVLVSAGIWLWARRRPVAAGVLLGLAVTARTYPLLVLLALVLLGARTGRFAAVRRVLLGAVVAVAAVLLPFLLGNPGAVVRSVQVWWDSAPGLGSVWLLPQLVGLDPLPTGLATLLSVSTTVLALVAGTVYALRPGRRPSLAAVSLVLVALTLLTGKAFPVQASLWLVPLVALCGLRWRDHLVWAGAEALHFVMVWLYVAGLSTPDRGLPPGWYAVFLLLRVAGVVWLVVRVWRGTAGEPAPRAPEPTARTDRTAWDEDEVDEPDEDELAGDFAGAPDRLLVQVT
ncbi:glycosyltransferase 87 family protein [Phycicoccus ginsengisoli]